jgi:hypothetical protein
MGLGICGVDVDPEENFELKVLIQDPRRAGGFGFKVGDLPVFGLVATIVFVAGSFCATASAPLLPCFGSRFIGTGAVSTAGETDGGRPFCSAERSGGPELVVDDLSPGLDGGGSGLLPLTEEADLERTRWSRVGQPNGPGAKTHRFLQTSANNSAQPQRRGENVEN